MRRENGLMMCRTDARGTAERPPKIRRELYLYVQTRRGAARRTRKPTSAPVSVTHISCRDPHVMCCPRLPFPLAGGRALLFEGGAEHAQSDTKSTSPSPGPSSTYLCRPNFLRRLFCLRNNSLALSLLRSLASPKNGNGAHAHRLAKQQLPSPGFSIVALREEEQGARESTSQPPLFPPRAGRGAVVVGRWGKTQHRYIMVLGNHTSRAVAEALALFFARLPTSAALHSQHRCPATITTTP